MMQTISVFALLALSSKNGSSAFQTSPMKGARTFLSPDFAHTKRDWDLFGLPTTKEEVAVYNKKVGAGVPPPSGNLDLYDPDEQGKLQGTHDCNMRIAQGYEYVIPSYKGPKAFAEGDLSSAEMIDAQHWLEHLDAEEGQLPLNFAKPNAPVQATVLGSLSAIEEDAPGDIQHIVMKLPEGFHYIEGQSLSVIPPGNNPVTGRPHKPRLYSIASTRYGDVLDGNTVSLCVRRALYYDPVSGKEDPFKKGICSDFLCNAPPGTVVNVAGPVGKTMLLPKDPTKDLIMVATGTGIAPFRGFMHRLFVEQTVARHTFAATAWLVLGVPTTSGLVYKEELEGMKETGMSLAIA
jgi:hypothetical protein